MDATPKCDLDLAQLPDGHHYEDRYQGYLDVFRKLAHLPANVHATVRHAPWSWVPLLEHLNCMCIEPRFAFEHCGRVAGAMRANMPVEGRGSVPSYIPLSRTDIEVLCSYRPECADALWKIDVQWKPEHGRVRAYLERGSEFIVTTNGAFHRPEVLEFMGLVDEYKAPKKRVVLVPCAADKPYPAPMHRAIMSRMPKDYYMMNVTGVVGLIPQELWYCAPHYDSGIPNRWRAYEMMKRYFQRNDHERIIVYCDFYSEAIQAALRDIGQDNRATYILPVQFYADYQNLMDDELLTALTRKFQQFARKPPEERMVPRFPLPGVGLDKKGGSDPLPGLKKTSE